MFLYAKFTELGNISTFNYAALLNIKALMPELNAAFLQAFALSTSLDAALLAIVWLSIKVSGISVVMASAIALPLGAWLALAKFPGRSVAIAFLNGLMGLPPVVMGLLVYLLLSRAGPLGSMGLLFTPTAMVIAQTFLICPIIAALVRQVVEDSWLEYREQFTSLGASRWQSMIALLLDNRFTLLTAVLAGFGRAAAEVGAVMIVGGNIDGVTRVMTTAIALETSKGDLPLAIALGLILIALIVLINAVAQWIKLNSAKRYG
jgi:tungstate transport system permease protein